MELDGDFETLEFRIGKRKTDTSFVRMVVKGQGSEHIKDILREVFALGAVSVEIAEVQVIAAPEDKVFPDNFYSTTNNSTIVYFKGEMIEVQGIIIDKAIAIDHEGSSTKCETIRDVKKGELIVVGEEGVFCQSVRELGQHMTALFN